MNKFIIITLLVVLFLSACESTNTYVLKTSSASSSLSGSEYSNLYIAPDAGEETVYNITGFPGDEYEVYIE